MQPGCRPLPDNHIRHLRVMHTITGRDAFGVFAAGPHLTKG